MLGLQDFKIDLPAVAALLTLVGYSVNDTIVVFDRIREVRGKNPELTPQMINDSVNQTLSRTLLTSFTVWLVVIRAVRLGRRRRPPVRLRHGGRRDRRHLQLDLHRQPAAADLRRRCPPGWPQGAQAGAGAGNGAGVGSKPTSNHSFGGTDIPVRASVSFPLLCQSGVFLYTLHPTSLGGASMGSPDNGLAGGSWEPHRDLLPAAAIVAAALVLGIYALDRTGPLWPDSPRYANAGAMVHDWLRSGELGRPIQFAHESYCQYPSFSIPYHPPLYPSLLGLGFLPLGVSYELRASWSRCHWERAGCFFGLCCFRSASADGPRWPVARCC